jgi:[protein-PII] uridylyltransferase
MNEAGVLGRFIPGFRQGRRDDAVQHVPSLHGRRAPDPLRRSVGIERGAGRKRTRWPRRCCRAWRSIAAILYVASSCTTSPRGGPRIIRSPAPSRAKSSARGSVSTAQETELVAWLVREHLTMSMVAQSRDLSDRKTIERFRRRCSVERLNAAVILTVCDIRAVGPGVWNGWKGQLAAHALFEAELMLRRLLRRSRARNAPPMPARRSPNSCPTGRREGPQGLSAAHYDNYLLTVDIDDQVRHAEFHPRGRQGQEEARDRWCARMRSRPSPRSRCCRRTIRGCCRSSRRPARAPAPRSTARMFSPQRRLGARHDPDQPRIRPMTATSCGGRKGSVR